MAQKFGEIAIYLSDDWLGAPKIGKITKNVLMFNYVCNFVCVCV
jgi:hypothetical protein